MKTEEIDEMLKLLKTATKFGKLTWVLDKEDTTFTTDVNGCSIAIDLYYDGVTMAKKASIELFNDVGDSFKKWNYSESVRPERYMQIKELYNLVKDQYFKISESERLILNGLRNLTQDI